MRSDYTAFLVSGPAYTHSNILAYTNSGSHLHVKKKKNNHNAGFTHHKLDSNTVYNVDWIYIKHK